MNPSRVVSVHSSQNPSPTTFQAPTTSKSLIKVGNFVRSKIIAASVKKQQNSIDYGRLKIIKKGGDKEYKHELKDATKPDNANLKETANDEK